MVSFDPASGETRHWLLKTKGVKDTRVIGYRRALELQQKIEGALLEIQTKGEIVHVCIEDFARGARNGREEAGMNRMATVLALGNVLGDVPAAYPTLVATSQVKKFATGNGGAGMQKSQVLKHVYKKWGFDTDNDNIGDAYVMARIAAALEGGAVDALQYERDVLANLGRHDAWEPPKS